MILDIAVTDRNESNMLNCVGQDAHRVVYSLHNDAGENVDTEMMNDVVHYNGMPLPSSMRS